MEIMLHCQASETLKGGQLLFRVLVKARAENMVGRICSCKDVTSTSMHGKQTRWKRRTILLAISVGSSGIVVRHRSEE